jgi:phosphonate transport system substrate-binding protein
MFTKVLGSVAVALAIAMAPVAKAAETIRFAVTDISGMENLQREFGAFKTALEGATGYKLDFFAVNSRTAAVEAMNAKQVDFVLTGPAEYVVFKDRTDAKVVVGWQRPDYFAQIVIMTDGPIKSVADLKGKKVAFGEIGSTSQHLGPAQALADQGLVYNKDYSPQIISRNVAVEAMIRGDIQAVGMNFTHLQRIRKAFPKQSFTVIARGRDLPNDILVVAPGVPQAVVDKVRSAFVEHSDKLIEAVLQGEDNKKYDGGHFLAAVQDNDYDYVRSMYRTIGVNSFGKFVGD